MWIPVALGLGIVALVWSQTGRVTPAQQAELTKRAGQQGGGKTSPEFEGRVYLEKPAGQGGGEKVYGRRGKVTGLVLGTLGDPSFSPFGGDPSFDNYGALEDEDFDLDDLDEDDADYLAEESEYDYLDDGTPILWPWWPYYGDAYYYGRPYRRRRRIHRPWRRPRGGFRGGFRPRGGRGGRGGGRGRGGRR